MLAGSKAFSSFSVNSLPEAKKFYSQVLGLETREDMGLQLTIPSGHIFLYPKKDHVPATFTVLNFPVPDIEKAVDELSSKGIVFEKYTGAIQTDSKGIFRGGGPLIAWFKDPAGNVLSIIQENS